MHHPQTSMAKCWKPIRSLYNIQTFHGGDERERSSSSASISLPPSLSLSLLKRVADVPAHPLERMRKHSSILGVGIIIIISRKYAHVPSRGRSRNGLQNLLETELQHILLQEQQVLGFKDSFLGNSVQTRTSTSMSNYFPTEIRKDASVSCKWIRKDKSGVFCLAVCIFVSCYQEVLRCFFFFLL